jgi:type VI secretion system secreted protein VgrG
MNRDEPILAHADARPTENARFIRLRTPLGPEVLIAEQLELDEAIGPLPGTVVEAPPTSGLLSAGLPARTFGPLQGTPDAGLRVVVHALSGDAYLDLQALLGAPMRVGLLTGMGPEDLRVWNGHVTHAARLGSDGGLARYRIVIEPWLSLLAHRVDSRVFQQSNVVQIVERVLAGYIGQGAMKPAWRWDLADPSVYPERSLSTQYRESDLAFVHRLMREEGLFYWWEHDADAHTLVIADHNGALTPSRQPYVRFTQGGPSLVEDSLTRLHTEAQVQTGQLHLASADYRSLSLRPQTHVGQPLAEGQAMLSQSDVPGAYAYENDGQGQRLLQRQMQAIDAQRLQIVAQGSLRSAAVGHYLMLRDHEVHDGLDVERDRLVVLRAQHRARNNLHADGLAQLQAAAGEPSAQADEPLHQCTLQLQPVATAVRRVHTRSPALATAHPEPDADSTAAADPQGWDDDDGFDVPDTQLHARPLVHGVQTALVVGLAEPVHTDRDQRIKLQFHWQRGSRASHRLEPLDGTDNAPADHSSGTWVRVATPVAGQNWGSAFTPRLGQEVLVAFIAGDIERPVVVGSCYNGQGQADAQGNRMAQGSAGATGNAPSWFPGQAQGHAHNAVLAGLKTQELPSSAQGGGGCNQLVFDDSPGQGRIELSTSQAGSRLQLGHLRQQSDNQRLTLRGHGLELATQAGGSVRAGAGLLVSAHGQAGSTQGGQQLEVRTALARLQSSQALLHTLAASAQDHQAQLQDEPKVQGATEKDTDRQLATERGLWALQDSLQAHDQREGGGAAQDEGRAHIGGGAGRVGAWARPELLLAAPSGIVLSSPTSGLNSAGAQISLVAGQDLGQLAQRDWTLAVKDGIVLYSYGRASAAQRAVQHIGIALHAANGSVASQSLTGATHLAAQQAVQVASTQAGVQASAPQHVLLAAAGAGIRIEAGAITLSAPGSIVFKAGMKVFTGPGGASAGVALRNPSELYDEAFVVRDELSGDPLALEPYHIVKSNGAVLAYGVTNIDGQTRRVFSDKAEGLTLRRGWPRDEPAS